MQLLTYRLDPPDSDVFEARRSESHLREARSLSLRSSSCHYYTYPIGPTAPSSTFAFFARHYRPTRNQLHLGGRQPQTPGLTRALAVAVGTLQPPPAPLFIPLSPSTTHCAGCRVSCSSSCLPSYGVIPGHPWTLGVPSTTPLRLPTTIACPVLLVIYIRDRHHRRHPPPKQPLPLHRSAYMPLSSLPPRSLTRLLLCLTRFHGCKTTHTPHEHHALASDPPCSIANLSSDPASTAHLFFYRVVAAASPCGAAAPPPPPSGSVDPG